MAHEPKMPDLHKKQVGKRDMLPSPRMALVVLRRTYVHANRTITEWWASMEPEHEPQEVWEFHGFKSMPLDYLGCDVRPLFVLYYYNATVMHRGYLEGTKYRLLFTRTS